MTLQELPIAERRGRRVARTRVGDRVDRSRWSVLVAYGLVTAATQAILVNYAPVTGDAARHFGVSVTAVGWLSQVYPLLYVLFAIPAGLLLDRFFRPALVAGTVLTAGGACLRLVGDDYAWALVGQVVAALGQPLVLNAITGLAVAYLLPKDRITGIGLASASVFGGMVVGNLLGASLPGEGHIRTITLVAALFACACGLLLLGTLRLVRPLELVVPEQRVGGFRAVGAAFGNQRVRRLCAVVAVPMGTFMALMTYTQPLLEPAGVSESSAGLILACTMVAGVVGCAIVPVWAERHGREVRLMAAAVVVTVGACIALALIPGTAVAYISLTGVGFGLLPALPIVLALTERHAPGAESTAAGLIWMAGNLGGVVIATVVGVLVTHPSTAFLAVGTVTASALVTLERFRRADR